MSGILEALGIRPANVDLLADRNVPLDAPMPYDPSYQVPGSDPAVRVGDVAGGLLQATPGAGDAYSVLQAISDFENERYASSVLNALGALPMISGMGAIKAYHGSPHKFDAFDMSKIGTGEGAQAYGHGLYFAESPETAKTYQADRSYVGKAMSGNPDGREWDAARIAQDVIDVHGDNAADHLRFVLKQNSKSKNPRQLQYNEEVAQALALVESGGVKPQGNLYETSLEWPDPAREASDPLGPQHFLDWDKPVREQSDALSSFRHSNASRKWFESDNPTGAELYIDMDRSGTPAYQSLRDMGIPGIRYLDQGSRGAGDGAYNYVVFDDKLVKILNRNGKPVSSVLETLPIE